MKEATDQMFKEMEQKLETISSQEIKALSRARKCLEVIHDYIIQLKLLILNYAFSDQEEEIVFFKHIKPRFVSQLIYFHHLLKIESNKPTIGAKAQKKYLKKELDFLKMYHHENKDFYQYYQTGGTYLDDKYFLRHSDKTDLLTEDFVCDRNPDFSTSHDHKVSKILAFENLKKYLLGALADIENSTNPYQKIYDEQNRLSWTGSKIALIELLYAFQYSGVFNHSNTDVRQIATYFERVFNVEIGNYYRAFQEIRNRKGARTRFLDQMREKLIFKMDEVDEGFNSNQKYS